MIERQIWPTLAKQLAAEEILVLMGPRQVGKTTTVKWLLEQIPENKLYLDLTYARIQEIFDTVDYNQIVNFLENSGLDFSKTAYVAIDEIQFSKNIPRIVKYLFDTYKIKFILTGSSSYYLKNYFNESLAGRKKIFEILPLSFTEFLSFQQVSYKQSKFSLPDFNNHYYNDVDYGMLGTYYEEYITYGGYPAVVLAQSVTEKKEKLQEIYSSYINLDVQTMSDFRSLSDFRRLISLLGARVGSQLNIDELSKILGLSRPTVMTYIAFLEQTYIIRLLSAYSNSADVVERIPKKVYFVDNGIANTNADLSGGAKFENMICHQLWFYGNLSFYNKDGEIDFILENDTGKYAFEVKETPTDNHLKTLFNRSSKLGITNFALIGREKTAKFHDYIWGGSF